MSKGLLLGLLLARLTLAAGDSGSWTIPEEEHFLQTARIISDEPSGEGLNHTRKVVLTEGGRTHAAHVQTIDVFMPLFKGKDGSEERDFKDSWKFNVAAWRLAKLLHLTYMVPACVERSYEGKPAAFDWWVDGVLMDEKARVQRNIKPPDMIRWNHQMDTIRIFDQLIYNMDRSQENLLITRNWDVWMIDHSRAFRKWQSLRNPAAITHCTPDLFRALKALRRDDVERELGPYLTAAEVDGLMARRDLIVAKLIANGEPTP